MLLLVRIFDSESHSKHLIQSSLGSSIGSKSGFLLVLNAVIVLTYTYPSSKTRKLLAEPESLDMNVIVLIGIRVSNSFCAVIIGPTAFVLR